MRAVLGLIAGIIALATPNPSLACKCAPPPSVSDALREASAVFEGRVTHQTAEDTELEVTLNVVQAWKGVQMETVRVRTRADSAACGVELTIGESYLVYATQRAAGSSGAALEVLRCGRTRAARDADEDYSQLGIGAVPVSAREPAAPGAPTTKPNAPGTPATNTSSQALDPAAGGCASCTLIAPAAANSSPATLTRTLARSLLAVSLLALLALRQRARTRRRLPPAPLS